MARALSRARSSTTRRAGPGHPPAASPPDGCSHGDVAAQRQGAGRRRFCTGSFLCERGTVRSGERNLERHRQPHHRTRLSHGDVAAQRPGAGGRGGQTNSRRPSRERGTLRSGKRDLDGHRQPRHRTRGHTATLLPNGQVLVAGGFNDSSSLSDERGTLRSGERDVDRHRQPRHRTRYSHGDLAAQRPGAGGRRTG